MADFTFGENNVEFHDIRFTSKRDGNREDYPFWHIMNNVAVLNGIQGAPLPDAEHWGEGTRDPSQGGEQYTVRQLRTLKTHCLNFLNGEHNRLPLHHSKLGNQDFEPTSDGKMRATVMEGGKPVGALRLLGTVPQILGWTDAALIKLGWGPVDEANAQATPDNHTERLFPSDAGINWIST